MRTSIGLLTIASMLSSSLTFARDETVAFQGAAVSVTGIPDTFKPNESLANNNKNLKVAGKAFMDATGEGTPFMDLSIGENPADIANNAFLEAKTRIVKENCAGGFSAVFIKATAFPAADADAIGRISCANKKADPASPYVEFYFVKRLSPTLAAHVTVASLGGNGISPDAAMKAATRLAKSISITSKAAGH